MHAFPALRLARLLLGAAITSVLAACGGAVDDGASAGGGSAPSLTGKWYSAQTLTTWTFYGGGTSGSGLVDTISTNYGSDAHQLTWIDYTVDTSAHTITYYITRAALTCTCDYNYDHTISPSKGPYTEKYTISGSSLTIGNGTYSKM